MHRSWSSSERQGHARPPKSPSGHSSGRHSYTFLQHHSLFENTYLHLHLHWHLIPSIYHSIFQYFIQNIIQLISHIIRLFEWQRGRNFRANSRRKLRSTPPPRYKRTVAHANPHNKRNGVLYLLGYFVARWRRRMIFTHIKMMCVQVDVCTWMYHPAVPPKTVCADFSSSMI